MEKTYLQEPDPFVRRWLEVIEDGSLEATWNFSIRLISFARRKELPVETRPNAQGQGTPMCQSKRRGRS
jgi:hypothetical protein